MKVYINDKAMELPVGSTLAMSLESAGIKPDNIATALNGNVIPYDRRSQTVLSDGDRILIIKAFYGG